MSTFVALDDHFITVKAVKHLEFLLGTNLLDFFIDLFASSTPIDVLQNFLGDCVVTLTAAVHQLGIGVADLVNVQVELVFIFALKAQCGLVVASTEAVLRETFGTEPVSNLLALLQYFGKFCSRNLSWFSSEMSFFVFLE